jgi:hypothetical protein
MKRQLFAIDELRPAVIRASIALDPDVPLDAQVDDLEDDLLWAEFPNAVHLDVGWRPAHDASGEFIAALNQNPYEYAPFLERRCRTLSSLRDSVTDLVDIARQRPSIRRPLVDEADLRADSVKLNEVVFDPLTPLEFQIDALKERLLDARYLGNGRIVTVGWTIAHSLRGEFITVVRFDNRDVATQIESPLDDVGVTSLPSVWEHRCKTIPELSPMIEQAISVAGMR